MNRPAYSSAIPGSLRRFPTPQAKPMPDLTPGDAVRITRSTCKGQTGRFVEASTQYTGSVWVAIDEESKGKQLPRLAFYTNQSRAPRKLLPLSWLESIPETI